MLCAFRDGRYKIDFAVQQARGSTSGTTRSRCGGALLIDLLADPFERASKEGMDYNHWFAEHMFLIVPGQAKVKALVFTFKAFPPRQKGASSASTR